MIKSDDGSKTIKIVRNGETANWFDQGDDGGESFELPDTVVGSRFEFIRSSDPLVSAQRQLERTKRQLEALEDNQNASFDLKNALRDIESAQKSLEEAESRLSDETD